MVQIAIVEDDAAEAKQIEGYVQRYASESGVALQVHVFGDGDELLDNYRPLYDIVFMDIQLQRLDGMSAAERLRELDKEVILVFVTNMAQYAIRGYAVDALDYLLKPVPYFAFSEELGRCLQRLAARRKSYLLLPTGNGVERVDVASIYYIESLRHRITVHRKEGDCAIVSTMKELEAKLASEHFFRCNSGYLVNLAQVSAVRDSVAMVGGAEVPVSRTRKKAFLAALTDYVGGVAR